MQERIQQRLAELAQQIAPYVTLGRISLVVAGLFLIIYAALGFVYVSEGLSQQTMRTDLTQKQNIIDRSIGRGQEVEAEYQRILAAIPSPDLTETDVFEAILQIASESGVAPQISYQGETAETIGGRALPAAALLLLQQVTGCRP